MTRTYPITIGRSIFGIKIHYNIVSAKFTFKFGGFMYSNFNRKLYIITLFLLLAIQQVLSQTDFARDDSYDFSGTHYMKKGGNDIDNFNIIVETETEFTHFKLNVKRADLKLNSNAMVHKYRVDMDNNGTWELNWTSADNSMISFDYPEPQDGISQNYTIKVEIEYADAQGRKYPVKTKYHDVTIYAAPRVFKDNDANTFIQLQDENCSLKTPVLFVEGFDPLNENFQSRYYHLTYDLITQNLYPNNYAIFILNFADGGRDMRENAEVVKKALESIHQLCPKYKIALAGLSMGGVISRYALADLENQNKSHDVGLFLSFDSPQDKAHINPELQDWIKGQDDSDTAIMLLQNNLKSLAAKQLLEYNTYDPSHNERIAFYNELNSLNSDGYPHSTYNVSVSNGTMNSTWGYGSVGRDLMTLKINDNLYKNVSAVQLDCGTGSKITNITTTRYGDIFPNPFIRIYYELSIVFNPVFIPTWSSLDLEGVNIDNITGDIISYQSSKFDDFITQASPLMHHELSDGSRTQIMNWLNLNHNLSLDYNLLNGGSINSIIRLMLFVGLILM